MNIIESIKNKYSLPELRIFLLSLFLFSGLLVLSVTFTISHVSKHILLAAAIGYLSIIFFLPLTKIPLFTLGWYSGTIYYLGREIRDYEKGTGHFDIGGFFGPFFGNIVTFGFSYLIYRDYLKIRDKDQGITISHV